MAFPVMPGGMGIERQARHLQAAAAIASEVERLALATGNDSRGTVGYIQSKPGEHNIIAKLLYTPSRLQRGR